PQKLTQNQKNNLRFLTGTPAGLIGASNGNPLMGAMAVRAADNSLDHNLYLTPDDVIRAGIHSENIVDLGGAITIEKEATPEQRQKQLIERFYKNGDNLSIECDARKSLIDCGEQNQLLIDFVNSEYSKDEELKALRRKSVYYLHENWDAVDKSVYAYNHNNWNIYGRPLLGMGKAGLQTVSAGIATGITCVKTALLGCLKASAISTPVIISGTSRLKHNWDNLGVPLNEQTKEDWLQRKFFNKYFSPTATLLIRDLGIDTIGSIATGSALSKYSKVSKAASSSSATAIKAVVNSNLPSKENLFKELNQGLLSTVLKSSKVDNSGEALYTSANSTKNLTYPSSGNGVGYNRFAPNNNFSTLLNPTARSTRIYAANSTLVSKEVKLNVLQRGSQRLQKARVEELKSQFNPRHKKPWDTELKFGGLIHKADINDSKSVPVFHNISDENAITYFKELAGIENLPPPLTIANKFDIHGNPAKVWTVKPAKGPFKGTTLNLRNFSTSQDQIPTKLTIEIVRGKNINKSISGLGYNSIEIKFVDK
ncbi:MAG: hypothetical protein Q4A26_03315, partial [Candidatus Saccharibacteria bacterium]|nr:hypothetical protein [Candidatus Saccharibacteria bacterium]